MKFNQKIVGDLRSGAKVDKDVCELVMIVRDGVEKDDFSSFIVMSYFIQAFGVSLAQIKELPGAVCLGGGVYSDVEIEEVIKPEIKLAMKNNKI